MARMVRKQIYIARHHDALLRRLSRLRNVSEAEVIRDAIDGQAEAGAAAPGPLDAAAWDEALRFMRGRSRRRPDARPPRRWRRQDAYDERLD